MTRKERTQLILVRLRRMFFRGHDVELIGGKCNEQSMNLINCAARLKDLSVEGLGSGCSARRLFLQLKVDVEKNQDLSTQVGIDSFIAGIRLQHIK